jgi:outer membrane protein OmpA-like peptidoglycan-associated protein
MIFVGLAGIAQTFNLESKRFNVGDVYQPTPIIMFELGRSEILENSFIQLDSIAALLILHDSLSIEIGNHSDKIDPRRSSSYSQKRAESIVNYLIDKGIDPNRLSAIGYGVSRPIVAERTIVDMDSEEEKQKAWMRNYRAEFVITRVDASF